MRQLVPPNCWYLSTVPARVTHLNTAVSTPHAVFFATPRPLQSPQFNNLISHSVQKLPKFLIAQHSK